MTSLVNTESIEQAYQTLIDAKQNFISACAQIQLAKSGGARGRIETITES